MEEIVWNHWQEDNWSCPVDKGDFTVANTDRGWHIKFWPIGQGMNFIELGYYLSPESAKLAAETYYLHRLRNGTL